MWLHFFIDRQKTPENKTSTSYSTESMNHPDPECESSIKNMVLRAGYWKCSMVTVFPKDTRQYTIIYT